MEIIRYQDSNHTIAVYLTLEELNRLRRFILTNAAGYGELREVAKEFMQKSQHLVKEVVTPNENLS